MSDYDLGPLRAALNELHTRCDYARDTDGEGFSASDTHYGKALAVLPVGMWTADMVVDAYEMLYAYRVQLAGYGTDWSQIPPPPRDEQYESGAGRVYARNEMKHRDRAAAEVGQRVIEWKKESATIWVRFPYDPAVVEILKDSVPEAHRYWVPRGRVWIVNKVAARYMAPVLDACEWTADEEVRALIRPDE